MFKFSFYIFIYYINFCFINCKKNDEKKLNQKDKTEKNELCLSAVYNISNNPLSQINILKDVKTHQFYIWIETTKNTSLSDIKYDITPIGIIKENINEVMEIKKIGLKKENDKKFKLKFSIITKNQKFNPHKLTISAYIKDNKQHGSDKREVLIRNQT